MILAIIAMVAFTPTLHTQTPVSTVPPASGGTNTGNGSTSGTGTSAGNGTASNCNVTGDDHEWDDQNESSGNGNGTHAWDGATPANGTEDHDWGECNATAGDHDGMGDRMSDGHHGHGEDDVLGAALEDAQSLVPLLSIGVSVTWNAFASVTGTLAYAFAGALSSGPAT